MDAALPAGEQSLLRSCSTVMRRMASSTTRCARGARAHTGSCRCTCWCRREWTVQQGHDLLEQIEADIRRALPPVTVLTHLEPLGDPAAMADQDLHRADVP